MFWSERREERLAELWHSGLITREIAKELKTTKGAVCGKARRMGLPERKFIVNPAERKRRRREQNRLRCTKFRLKKHRPSPPKRPPVDVPPPDGITTVTLLERRISQCAYPIGDRFCGAPVFSKPDGFGSVMPTSWCDYHYNIVHIKKGPNGAKKEKIQRRIF